MPHLHAMLSPVKRNLLHDLEATEFEENYPELVHSLTICNAARLHPDDVRLPDLHEKYKDVLWRKPLRLSSVSSKNSISVERDNESDICPNETSKTLLEAMTKLRLNSVSIPASNASVDSSDVCSMVQRKTSVAAITKNTDDHPEKKTEKCIHLVVGRAGMRINSRTVLKKKPVLLDAKSMIVEDTSVTQEHEELQVSQALPSSYMADQAQFTTDEEPLPACESACNDCTSGFAARESSQANGRARHPVDRACRNSKFRRGSSHFVSMAEAIRKFQTATPKRFHTSARPAASRRAKNRLSGRACIPPRTKNANTSKKAQNAKDASRATLKAGTLLLPTVKIEGNQYGDCSVSACKSLISDNSAARRLSPAMRARRQLPPQPANATVTRPRHLLGDQKSHALENSEREVESRQMLRRKEKEADMHRAAEKQKREMENREIREVRRTLVIRARPMPVFKPPLIAKSTKPLTVPHSPAWSRKKM